MPLKPKKTGNTIFGLSSVVAGVSMILTETAIEEERERQQLARDKEKSKFLE